MWANRPVCAQHALVYVGDTADVSAWLDRDEKELARLKAQIVVLERKNYELVATVLRLTEYVRACVHPETPSLTPGGRIYPSV